MMSGSGDYESSATNNLNSNQARGDPNGQSNTPFESFFGQIGHKLRDGWNRIVNDDICPIFVVVVCFMLVLALVMIAGIDAQNYTRSLIGFEVDSLRLNSLTISHNPPNNYTTLNATNLNLVLFMKLRYPKKMKSCPLVVLLEYQGEVFSSATTDQPSNTQNQTFVLDLDMDTSSTKLSQAAIDSIAKDVTSHNDLEFTVRVQGHNWLFNVPYKGDKYDVNVICKGLKVRIPSNYNISSALNLINAPIVCKVKLLDRPGHVIVIGK